jgi:hypothetical protein
VPYINVTEGEDFPLERGDAELLRNAIERLEVQLRPSFSLLRERAGCFRLMNVLGSIDLGGGTIVQVSPKVATEGDWVSAVVALLTGSEAVDAAGERQASFSIIHNKLLDAIAGIYLQRLESAFRREGPIMLMERVSVQLPHLHGTLNVTKWVRTALWQPHIFPVSRTELARVNPFTRGLLYVAEALAHQSSNLQVRAKLRTLARDLSAGLPHGANGSPLVTTRPLPAQWSAYKPAWSLALAILTKTSLFGPTGHHTGVGLAIEAWPLLEALLKRTLQAIERVGQKNGRLLTYEMQGNIQLLRPLGPAPQKPFEPAPDGRLYEGEKLITTWEAKYSNFDGTVPAREHVYQALTTAAGCGASVAVLVYPGKFDPLVWEVRGFNGGLTRLIAVGLDLFRQLTPEEAYSRGEQLLEIIDGLMTGSTKIVSEAKVA